MRGRIELGCGLALPSIAAARAGGRVLATDWSRDAVAAAASNARRNGAEIETLVCDWAEPAPLLERGPFQLVLASDVLYEQRNVDQLLELLPRLVDDHGRILLADPGRAPSERFLEGARGHFDVTTTMSARFPRVAIHRLRGRSASAT